MYNGPSALSSSITSATLRTWVLQKSARTRAHEFFDHTPLRRSPPPSCAAWTCRTRPLSALRPCAPAGLSHRAGGAAIAASGGVAGGAGGHALEVAAPKGRLNFLSVPALVCWKRAHGGAV